MNELDKMDFSYVPSIEEVENTKEYKKIPLTEISSLGMIGSLFMKQTQTVTSTLNTEGLFSAVIPEGMHLANFKDGSGKLGTLLNESNKISGQARFNELPGVTMQQTISASINPTMVCMTVMLLNIDKKLDAIQESQKEMMSVLKSKEHGDIKGNIHYLYDILSNLKNRFGDEQYKKEYRLKVHDIIQDSYKYIETYKERLTEAIKDNKGFHISFDVDKELNKLVEDFGYYRLSIFMFAYAHYVELLLGSYIDENLIQNELNRLNECKIKYRQIYTDLYNYLDELYKSSLDKQAINVLGGATEGLGKLINMVPFLEKGPVDEALVDFGKDIQKNNNNAHVNTLEKLRQYKLLNVDGFVNQYDNLAYLYSGQSKILFDKDNLYVSNRCLS